MNAHLPWLLASLLVVLPIGFGCAHVKSHVPRVQGGGRAANGPIKTAWWEWVPEIGLRDITHDAQGNIVLAGMAAKGMDLDPTEGVLKLSAGFGAMRINGSLSIPPGAPMDQVRVTLSPQGKHLTTELIPSALEPLLGSRPTTDGDFILARKVHSPEAQAIIDATKPGDQWNVEPGVPATVEVARLKADGSEVWRWTSATEPGIAPIFFDVDGAGRVYVMVAVPRKIAYASEAKRQAAGHRDYDQGWRLLQLSAEGQPLWEGSIQVGWIADQEVDEVGTWHIVASHGAGATFRDSTGKEHAIDPLEREDGGYFWEANTVVLQVTAAGELGWISSAGYDTFTGHGLKLAVAPDGAVYSAMEFMGSGTFGDGQTRSSRGENPGIALKRMDANGEVAWVRHYISVAVGLHHRNDLTITDLVVDRHGGPVLLGLFSGECNFAPGGMGGNRATLPSVYNPFVLLLNERGGTRQVTTYNGSWGYPTVELDPAGDLLICGTTDRDEGFDPRVARGELHQPEGQFLAKINLP